MDEMTQDFGNVVTVVLWLLGAMALALFVVALWLGQRRMRLHGARRALVLTNLMVLANAGSVAMMVLSDARFPENPWQWLVVFVTGPGLAGYALGTTLGLLRR